MFGYYGYYLANELSWSQYLQTQSIQQSNQDIKIAGQNITDSVNYQTMLMLASDYALIKTASEGMGSLQNGLNKLSEGIVGLNSSFNWAMGQLIDRADTMLMMQDKTNNILLSVLSQVSRYDDEKKIQGYIEQGLKNYNSGEEFMQAALTYFHKAEELIPANDMPFLLYKLGQIYLYHIDTIDLNKALKYFADAGKYYRRDNESKKACESYLFAGIAAYLSKDYENALKYTKQSMELDHNMLEAYYNYAKYLAVQKNASGLDTLEIAVRKDRNYAVKALADKDFANISEELKNLIDKLRTEVRNKVEQDISNLEKKLDEYFFFDESEKNKVEELLNKTRLLFKKNTYFDYLDASLVISSVHEMLSAKINIKQIATLGVGEYDDIHITSVAFSPDGQFILTRGTDDTDYTAKLWEVSSGKEIRTLEDIISANFSPDGQFILTRGTDDTDYTAKLWEVSRGRKIRTLSGHSDYITSVAFSPDGQYILTGSFDNTAKLWEVSSGREIRTLSGHSDSVDSVAFSPDGQFVLTNSCEATKLWEVPSGKEIRTLSGLSVSHSAALSPDGQYILTGGFDNTVKVWEVSSGEEIRTLSGHSDYVGSVAFSPDGQYILTRSLDNTAKLWEVSSGEEIRTLSGYSNYVDSVAFSPNGQYILTGNSDNTAKLWEVSSGKEIRTLSGHSSHVNSVAFSPDGQYILTGSSDNTAKLWEVSSGKEIRTLSGHSSHVNSVAFSPDGQYILTGSSDNTAKLWEIEYLIISKAEKLRREEEKKKREEESHRLKEVLRLEERHRLVEEARRLEESRRLDELARLAEARRLEEKRAETKLLENIQRQKLQWRTSGMCEECGVKLGFMDKFLGKSFCKSCCH